ncbi:MAG: YqgE/AlgH family protein [Opitutaceae bacterium]|jgi:putative transcriptional regulator|nr:YqgE/AlgH family protein [Opitutaceae bacterium]
MRESPTPAPEPFVLAGSLLLAHPAMNGDAFRRSVVLLSTHDENGAMGIVLNRPLGKQLGQLDPAFALTKLADVPLYRGGPVETARLMLCGWRFHPDGSGFQLMFGINPDKALDLLDTGGVHLRGFMGYSGWSAGQLENEMKHQAWVVSPLRPDAFAATGRRLWSDLLGSLAPEWKLLANEPDDPALN